KTSSPPADRVTVAKAIARPKKPVCPCASPHAALLASSATIGPRSSNNAGLTNSRKWEGRSQRCGSLPGGGPGVHTLTVHSTDDVRLHVVTSADPADSSQTGPLVLFVHGYPDTHRTWEPQMAALRGDCRVVAFDLRGAGASTAPRDQWGYAIERVLPDLTAVI